MGLLVTFFLGSIFFSFLCSILEAVLLSITPAYVGLQEQANTKIANDLARYKEDIDRLSRRFSLLTLSPTQLALLLWEHKLASFLASQISVCSGNL